MKFLDLVRLTKDEPVFTTGLLISGEVDPKDVRRQLSRWTEAGKIIQLRKGVYALAAEFRANLLHPFVIANRLVKASYVSLQSALAFYGMIPEYVPVTTSVTTQRPWSWDTSVGAFSYRHVKTDFFHGYGRTEVAPGVVSLVATREKALCDLVHLTPRGDTREYLDGLRLQGLDAIDVLSLRALAARGSSAKLERAVRVIETLTEKKTPR